MPWGGVTGYYSGIGLAKISDAEMEGEYGVQVDSEHEKMGLGLRSKPCDKACIMEMDQANPDVADREVALNYANAGSALVKLKRWNEALTNFLAARAMYKTLKLPSDMVHCDEEIALCYFWLDNGMEAQHYAQLAMDFADTAEDDFHKMWALARLALAKKALEQYDEALELFADAKSRMVRMENPNWRAIVKLERQVASILVIKGRVSEAQEIERRIASMAEIVFDEGEE